MIAMPKTISSSEVRRTFGTLLRWIEDNHDAVIITRRGEPVAVLISYAEYQELQRLQKQESQTQG
jgi:prevent-host-death family protein